MLDTGSWVLASGCRMLDISCVLRDAGCGLRVANCSLQTFLTLCAMPSALEKRYPKLNYCGYIPGVAYIWPYLLVIQSTIQMAHKYLTGRRVFLI